MTERQYVCGVDATLGIISGRWKGTIIYCLLERPWRFGELQRYLSGISARVLTLQLRELERDLVVHREDFNEVPPRVEYSVTAFGRSLEAIVHEMEVWGDRYLEKVAVEKQSGK